MIRLPPRSTRTGHTLSLHDALPIFPCKAFGGLPVQAGPQRAGNHPEDVRAGPLPTFLEKSRPREEPGRSAAADPRAPHLDQVAALQIGRASCRERVCLYV